MLDTSLKSYGQPNIKFQMGRNFDSLYFHAKSQVKRKKIKIKCSTSLKRAGHVESKFDRLNFYAKSSVKSEKYHKIKFDTSLKSYGHAQYKILDQEQF